MNRLSLILGFVACFLFSTALAIQEPRAKRLLSERYPIDKLSTLLVSKDSLELAPLAGSSTWQNVPKDLRALQIQAGLDQSSEPWAALSATLFLEFERDGNRSRYQKVFFERRRRLAELVLAETLEDKGRFLDAIADGVWLICEETYWGVPAHVSMQQKGVGLPDVEEPTIDLFAAETASLLSWTDYLLRERLDRISPRIRERIAFEVDRRILTPGLERTDFWWMGYGRDVNNWNPWICSNWLTAVLCLEKDSDRRVASIAKILEVLDHFLDGYPDDGGCDEGPGYWDRAGGSLFDCLDLLHTATGGEIDIFEQPLVKEIGRYIYRTCIYEDFFVNFADANAVVRINAPLVFKYGRTIEDRLMQEFAAANAQRHGFGRKAFSSSFGGLGRALRALSMVRDVQGAKARDLYPRDVWLPQTQVMIARENEGNPRGFFVAAKGGHNDESHNHNDVGNFIVYHDGSPILVDAGVGTYTRQTFSDRRYEIWTMQSAYHNLPSFNGHMQEHGRQFRAESLSYQTTDAGASLRLDVANAYPSEANIQTFIRTIELSRARPQVAVTDKFALKAIRGPSEWNLLTPLTPERSSNGRLTLHADEKASFELAYTLDESPSPLAEAFSAELEEIPLTDEKLQRAWGEKLHRIRLNLPGGLSSGTVRLEIFSPR